MLRLTILKVGSIREPFYSDGMREYEKRMNPYASVFIRSVADESLRGSQEQARAREGQRLIRELDRLSPDHVTALDVAGKIISSHELSRFLSRQALYGHSHLCFLIGGTTGLSPEVLQHARWRWSLSRLTFPHQMVPLILLEQLYRGFKIMRGEPYHH